MRDKLLTAPEGQIDPAVLKIIERWDSPGTAANVLETLDCAVYCGGASEFVMQVLHILLERAIISEKTTYDAVVKNATWRLK